MTPLSVVSVTERNSFRTCRRRWDYDRSGKFPAKRIPTPLWFGSAMHRGLQAYHGNGRTLDDLLAGYRRGVDEQIAALTTEQGFCAEAVMADVDENFAQGIATLMDYCAYDHEVTRPEWVVVDTERRHHVTISPDLPQLTGQIDLLVRIDGELWVIDHKNVSRKQDQRSVDIDPQLTGYCYLVQQVYGEIPRGAIINSLLKKKPAITLRAPKLGTDPWAGKFVRLRTERSREAIDNYPWRAAVEMQEMVDVAASPERAYPNPGWACAQCSYFDTCLADLSGATGYGGVMPWEE